MFGKVLLYEGSCLLPFTYLLAKPVLFKRGVQWFVCNFEILKKVNTNFYNFGKKQVSADFVFVHRHFLIKPSINTNIQYSADHKIKLPNTLLYLWYKPRNWR